MDRERVEFDEVCRANFESLCRDVERLFRLGILPRETQAACLASAPGRVLAEAVANRPLHEQIAFLKSISREAVVRWIARLSEAEANELLDRARRARRDSGPAEADSPIRFDLSRDEPVLLCPVCGGTYTHARGAYTLMGGDEGKVYEGTIVRGTTSERRSALVVEFWCEHGHDFKIVLQQAKGETFVSAEEVPQ